MVRSQLKLFVNESVGLSLLFHKYALFINVLFSAERFWMRAEKPRKIEKLVKWSDVFFLRMNHYDFHPWVSEVDSSDCETERVHYLIRACRVQKKTNKNKAKTKWQTE